MATIYISYKLEDKDLAKALAKELEDAGHNSVYDAVALAPGEDWRRVLLEELGKADAMVVLLTERALRSHFVLGEIGAARALRHTFGHILTIPVVVGDLPIPPVVSDLFVVHMSEDEAGVRHAAAEIHRALAEDAARRGPGSPRIFISHRHRDVKIAEALVRLIEVAFTIAPTDMRCTSVHPYRLRAGDRTSDRLRAELSKAKAVLGILTPDTRESSYVLFELGASWGRGAMTFPLLARGATLTDVPSPISDLHSLSLQQSDQCFQLIDDLVDVTGLPRQNPAGALLAQRVAELVAAAGVEAPGP